MDIENAAKLVSEWAAEKPEIRAVRFFGSRVKGTHRTRSDIDIAITLMPNLDGSGGLATWMGESDKWERELFIILPHKVQLEWDAGSRTKIIEKGLREASIQVYEREI